jgi:hypothetical protein
VTFSTVSQSTSSTITVAVVVPIGEGDDTSSGNSKVGAAIGGSLGGLALLAVLILFVLLKRRKTEEVMNSNPLSLDEEEVITMTEVSDYISEYGLSDGRLGLDNSEEGEDDPGLEVSPSFDLNEEGSGGSEYNPEGSEVIGVDDIDEGK